MIKRLIGITFTLATLAVVCFAIMNWGNYRSMLFGGADAATEQTATVEQRDSVVVEPDVVLIDETTQTEPQEMQ